MAARAQVAGSVVAGFPSPAEQYLEPPLDLNALLVRRPAATYFVRVTGDSMVGAGIHEGDILVVDRSLTPADGDIVIAAVDGEFTVKRIRFEDASAAERAGDAARARPVRRVLLEPANPAYPTITLAGAHELRLFGKVTAVVHLL